MKIHPPTKSYLYFLQLLLDIISVPIYRFHIGSFGFHFRNPVFQIVQNASEIVRFGHLFVDEFAKCLQIGSGSIEIVFHFFESFFNRIDFDSKFFE